MGFKCITGPYGNNGRMYVWVNNKNTKFRGVIVIDGCKFKTEVCYSATEACEEIDGLTIT